MNRRHHSLVSRLALLFALLSFAVLLTVSYALYAALVAQLVERDDAALVTRADQIRTLLRDADLLKLINDKPELFANMLGNRESLLVLKFPGEKPLLEVNPGHLEIPEIPPVAADAGLGLSSVQHLVVGDTPFIVVSVLARANDPQHAGRYLEITTCRLLTERTRMLDLYRGKILAAAVVAALVTALLAYWIARRSLLPIRALATQTAAIGIGNLATRIDCSGAPQELLPFIEGFNAMLDRLETSFAKISQVSADMAHDFRTPVGNLMGQIEVALGQRRSTEYYEKLLGSNFEELQRLSKMADNMLFLARSEHADHAIDRRPLEVAEELELVVEYFEGLVEERNIGLAWHGDGTIWADPTLLRRALANLLSNAVRYADAGTKIVLSSQQDASGTTVTVENCGPTIEEEHLSRLFDRFYRADASRSGSSEASGLGLSIVRSIMLLHHGSWNASSKERITRFSLFFPRQRDL